MSSRPRPRVVPITAPSFPTLPRPYLYRKIAYTFIALVILMVIGVVWFSSVHAIVIVKVKQQSVKISESVDLARTPKQGEIPARVVQGVFEKIQKFDVKQLAAVVASSSAETVTVPVTMPKINSSSTTVQARGTVRIINKYSKAQTLVKTTRLFTEDKKLYRIDKNIVIPAGGEVTVSVYADQMGEEFVIGPSQFTIPGLFIDLQKYIYAVSDNAFIPVTVKASIASPVLVVNPKTPSSKVVGMLVSTSMIDQAQKQVSDAVLAQAKQALAAEVGDSKFSEIVYFIRLVDKKSNASVGQTTDEFLASVKLDVTAVFYPREDMFAFIRSKFKDRIPDGRELIPFEAGSISYSLESADPKTETATVHVNADAGYRLSVVSPALQKSVIAGKSKEDALALLKTVEGVDNVTIELRPRWVRSLPELKDRIEVRVE